MMAANGAESGESEDGNAFSAWSSTCLTQVWIWLGCKAAYLINMAKHPDLAGVPEDMRRWATRGHPTTLNWGPAFADRFSQVESKVLWERFETLDARLQAQEEHYAPGFQSGPMRYNFNEMPDFDVDDFVANWNK